MGHDDEAAGKDIETCVKENDGHDRHGAQTINFRTITHDNIPLHSKIQYRHDGFSGPHGKDDESTTP